MPQSVPREAASGEQKYGVLPECRRILLDQDDDVTSALDPLLDPQSRRTPTEVNYVA